MADHAEYLRTKFTVAAHLDEEQKRQIEGKRLRDDAQRDALEEMMDRRDKALAALKAKQDEERQEIVEQEVRKRLQGTSDLRFEMRGGGRVSLRERERSLRRSIDEQLREKHDREIEEERARWNERIDRELERALERETRPAREQEIEENKRDITASPLPGVARGRSEEGHPVGLNEPRAEEKPRRDYAGEIEERQARARARGRDRDFER